MTLPDVIAWRWAVVGMREGSQPVAVGPFVTELAALEWCDEQQSRRNGALYALTVVEVVLPTDLPQPVPYRGWRETDARLAELRGG